MYSKMKNLILIKLILISITPLLFAAPSGSLSQLEVNTQILAQSGKVLAAGYIESASGQDLAIECYKENGELDLSFGQSGRFSLAIPHSNEQVFALHQLANGNLVLSAQSIISPKTSLIHIQLTKDGQLVSKTSSTLGELVMPKKLVSFGSAYLLAGLVKKDGEFKQFLQAFMSNGQPLRGFGSQGTLYIASNGQFKDLAVQNNQHILLLGQKLLQISPKGQILHRYQPGFKASCLAISNNNQFYLGGSAIGNFILQEFDAQAQPLSTPQKEQLPYYSEAQLRQIILKDNGKILLAGQVESSEFDHNTDWILLTLHALPELNLRPAKVALLQFDLSIEDDEIEKVYLQKEQISILGFANSFEDRKAIRKNISALPQ